MIKLIIAVILSTTFTANARTRMESIKNLDREAYIKINKAQIEFIIKWEKNNSKFPNFSSDSKKVSLINRNLNSWSETFMSSAFAGEAGSGCFFGGWPSLIGTNGKCRLPWQTREHSTSKGLPGYGPACGGTLFRCNPSLFGGIENAPCVESSVGYKDVTKSCQDKMKADGKDRWLESLSDDDFKKWVETEFAPIQQEIGTFCLDSNEPYNDKTCESLNEVIKLSKDEAARRLKKLGPEVSCKNGESETQKFYQDTKSDSCPSVEKTRSCKDGKWADWVGDESYVHSDCKTNSPPNIIDEPVKTVKSPNFELTAKGVTPVLGTPKFLDSSKIPKLGVTKLADSQGLKLAPHLENLKNDQVITNPTNPLIITKPIAGNLGVTPALDKPKFLDSSKIPKLGVTKLAESQGIKLDPHTENLKNDQVITNPTNPLIITKPIAGNLGVTPALDKPKFLDSSKIPKLGVTKLAESQGIKLTPHPENSSVDQPKLDSVDCSLNGITPSNSSPARLKINCNSKTGYLKNDAKVMKLKLIVTSSVDGNARELTLSDLPGEAKDYFPLLNNDWVRTRLDLKDGESVDLAENGLVLDSENILYESDEAKVQIGTIKSAPAEKQHCWRDGNDPSFFSYSGGCGMKKMCLINVKCKLPGEDYTVSARAFCKANINNTCPSPDECAADTDTDVQLVD